MPHYVCVGDRHPLHPAGPRSVALPKLLTFHAAEKEMSWQEYFERKWSSAVLQDSLPPFLLLREGVEKQGTLGFSVGFRRVIGRH